MKVNNAVQRQFWAVDHRGARTDSDPQRMAPENTIPAFQESARRGLAIELDVMSTADGHMVVHHDEKTGRMFQLSGKQKKVAKTTFSELRAAQLNVKGHEATIAKMMAGEGNYKTPDKFRTVQIPELAEVLDAVPNTHVFVELKPTKHQPRGFEAAVLKVIQQKNAHDRVTLISFDSSSLRRVKQLDPTVRTALNFKIPKGLQNNTPFLWAYTNLFAKKWAKVDGLQPDYGSATPKLIQLSHAAEMPIVPWVDNQTRAQEKASFPTLLGLDVDGLITNAGDLLKQALPNNSSQSTLSSVRKASG